MNRFKAKSLTILDKKNRPSSRLETTIWRAVRMNQKVKRASNKKFSLLIFLKATRFLTASMKRKSQMI